MKTIENHYTLLQPDAYLWIMAAAMLVISLLLLFVWWRTRRRSLRWLCPLLTVAGWYFFLYGTFAGIRGVEVRHEEFVSADLPEAFDGYRIVQFSDVHTGSYDGWREPLLREVVDSINAQRADLIVFTGDIQNKVPDEIMAHGRPLRHLKAKDGVCSVMGNHDYAVYSDRDDFTKTADIGRTCSAQIEMGWYLLNNSSRRIRRDSAAIYIAGMQNDGEGRFPQLGDIQTTLNGLSRQSFVVMLEHDPSSWGRKILPHSHCQLTLSGHTHGGQMSLLGLSPAMIGFREYAGMYHAGDRALNVSTGVGGVIPFRFGVKPEIVVITLKKKK